MAGVVMLVVGVAATAYGIVSDELPYTAKRILIVVGTAVWLVGIAHI
jgi:hypothetical protein